MTEEWLRRKWRADADAFRGITPQQRRRRDLLDRVAMWLILAVAVGLSALWMQFTLEHPDWTTRRMIACLVAGKCEVTFQ